MESVHASEVTTRVGRIPLLVSDPPESTALVVLGPGAGAGMEHPFMGHVAAGLADRRLAVARFDFPYMAAGRRAPDKQPVLEAAYRDVVEHLRPVAGGRRLVLGGKSMGGRIASHIAAAGTSCDGLVFLGYPLHPPGKPEKLRSAHLESITTPMLFVEGTRDPFCPLATLEEVRAGLSAPTSVAIIDDGDHSFKVRKSSGRTSQQAWDEVVTHVATWVEVPPGG